MTSAAAKALLNQLAGPADASSNSYRTFQDAWSASLRTLLNHGGCVAGVADPTSVGSCFGETIRETREMMGTAFAISAPRMRIVKNPFYSLNLSFAIANVIWVLTGADDVEMISFYNPRGRKFTDDGFKINSAPGPRIFCDEQGSQFDRVVEILRRDPSSRRAFFQIALPSDLLEETRDVSCVFNLQFFIRDNFLHCITHMRSQSAFRVMPYDIYLFTMLQEAVAISLEKELGSYFHLCGSLHIYKDEEPYIHKVLNSPFSDIVSMERMKTCDAETRMKLKEAEKEIREALSKDKNVCGELEKFGLDGYWTTLLKSLIQDFRQKHPRAASTSSSAAG